MMMLAKLSSWLPLCSAVLVAVAIYGLQQTQQRRRSRFGGGKKRKSSKQKRREEHRVRRRARKDANNAAKKEARQAVNADKADEMSEEQRREQRERIKMMRVEQYQKLDEGLDMGLRVVVDLAFAEAQTKRECNSVLKQLGCAYGYLKKCPLDSLISLRVASFSGEIARICELRGLNNWKIWCHEASIDELYEQQEIVYLSPDAEDVLHELDPSCVYVIGGIVDRSVRKGQTMTKAGQYHYKTARLPIQEFLPARTHILNIDSVLVALNEFSNHKDWARAFEVAIPKRIAQKK